MNCGACWYVWVCVHLRVIVNYYNKDPALTTLLANTRSKRLALINAGISRHPDLYNTINIRNRSQSASSIHLAGSGSIKNAPRKLSSGHIQLVNQLPAGGGGRVGLAGGALDMPGLPAPAQAPPRMGRYNTNREWDSITMGMPSLNCNNKRPAGRIPLCLLMLARDPPLVRVSSCNTAP